MYLDNPGGTQVHRSVYEAVTGFYERANANLDGPFETSILAGDVLSDARARRGVVPRGGIVRRDHLRRQYDHADDARLADPDAAISALETRCW